MRRLIALTLAASITQAAQLSEHNEQHAAVQAALDRLYSAGCTRTDTTRSGRYGLHDSESADYTISGVTLTVRCTQWPAPPADPDPVFIVHYLTWTRPITRMDGSTLPPDQISGYMLNKNGVMEFVPGGNTLSYVDDGLSAGTYVYSIATVDTSAQVGPHSAPLTVVAH